MARIMRLGLPGLIGWLAVAGAAHAQAIPEIEESITQGAQIEEAIGRTTAPRGPAVGDDQAIDGEAGVYVLKKEQIFYVAANAGIGFSSNPLRTSDDVGGSGSVEASLSAGMRTRLAGAFDLGIAANLEGTRYFEDFAPSNHVASGNVSIGTAIGGTPLYVGAAGFGGWNLDEDFESPVGFYGASAHLSANIPLAPALVLLPSIAATRQWSEIEENDTKSLSGRMAIHANRGPLSVDVSAGVTRIWFDNFYEDVTFVARHDWQYDAGLSIAYRLAPKVVVNASVRYVKRDSPFFLSSFTSVDNGASIALLWRF